MATCREEDVLDGKTRVFFCCGVSPLDLLPNLFPIFSSPPVQRELASLVVSGLYPTKGRRRTNIHAQCERGARRV